MWEKILTFVTPGPLTERFGFTARVFYSWISLGLIIALIGFIFIPSSRSIAELIPVLIGMPIFLCALGLIGLAVNYFIGNDSEYPGWYWWLFPIVTYVWLIFIIIVGIFASLLGISLPKSSHKPQVSKIDPHKFRQQLENMKAEELLKEFDKQFIEIGTSNKIKPEEKKVIKKLQELDRSELRSDLRNAFNDDEMEILYMLILKLSRFELR